MNLRSNFSRSYGVFGSSSTGAKQNTWPAATLGSGAESEFPQNSMDFWTRIPTWAHHYWKCYKANRNVIQSPHYSGSLSFAECRSLPVWFPGPGPQLSVSLLLVQAPRDRPSSWRKSVRLNTEWHPLLSAGKWWILHVSMSSDPDWMLFCMMH